jgi:hypothetical protein
MAKRRKQLYDGANFEELQTFLLKLTRRLRDTSPPAQVVKELDQTEAWVELMMVRCDGNLLLH